MPLPVRYGVLIYKFGAPYREGCVRVIGNTCGQDPTPLCQGRDNCRIPPEGIDCARIKVASGFFQEIYTGKQAFPLRNWQFTPELQ
jgi:hypothetical protein